MSEITKITAVTFAKNDEKFTIVSVSAKTPKNVVNDDYFSFCCQYHAFNIQLKVAESEMLSVQYEDLGKLSKDNNEALKLHKDNVEKAEAFIAQCKKLVNNFISQVPVALLEMFKNDKFALAYTYRLMNVSTFNTAENVKNGVKIKKIPVDIYNDGKYTESVKGANWKLSSAVTTLFDSTTPKAVKQEVFKPLVNILNEMFGISEINKTVYKLPNFNQITNTIWSKYAQTLLKGNNKIVTGIGYSMNKESANLISLQTAAMTHLHVVESAENEDSKKAADLSTWAKEFTKSLEKTKEKVAENKEEKTETK